MGEQSPADLMLHCSICKSSYNLSSVRDHKKHHGAMRVMRFKQGSGPRSLESLSKRHRALMKKVLAKERESPVDFNLIKRLERISDAYESLRHEFTGDDTNLKALLPKDGKTSMRDGFFEERDRGYHSECVMHCDWMEIISQVMAEQELLTLEDEIEHKAIGSYKQQGYPSCVYGIGRSQAMNRNWRDRMEDTTSIEEGASTPPLNRSCYIGMFDGYHGNAAARTCNEKMSQIIFEEITGYQSNLDGDIKDAQDKFSSTNVVDDDSKEHLSDVEISNCIARAYQKMDQFLGHGISEKSRVRWSGCSALTCLISDDVSNGVSVSEKDNESAGAEPSDDTTAVTRKNQKLGQLYVSNAGNVQAVLYQNRKPIVLNRCHVLTNEEEHKRVIKAGASINSNETRLKINGVMETTRGLGNHGDVKLKKCVIPTPQTSAARLTEHSQILVIATHSLWEVLNPHDVFTILLHYIPPDAMTVLKSGPIPIVPIMHGHLPAGDEGDGGHRLPSIVETEEDEAIEEVIFVHAEHSDSEDDDENTKTGAFGDSGHSDSNFMNKTKREDEKRERDETDGSMSMYSTVESSGGLPMDPHVEKDAVMRRQYSRVACDLSSHLVRSAIEAGAYENVSAVVVLFEGLFNHK